VHKNFWGEKNIKPFIHLSFGKAGPFTLESHIHVKALKMQGFPNNYRCLIKPLFKNSTHLHQTNFQGVLHE